MVNFTAYTDEAKEFGLGEQVLVVSTEQNRLWVVSTDNLDQSSEVSRENRSQRLKEERES